MRKVLIATVVAILLLLIAAIAGPFFIPTDKYRSFIEQSIGGAGARVSMESFRLRFIPYAGYTIKGLAVISTEPPFVGQTAISVGKVEGDLSLIGLLRGEIVTAVRLYDPNINYRVADGVSNLGRIFGFSSGHSDDASTKQFNDESSQTEFSDEDVDSQVEFKSLPAVKEEEPVSAPIEGESDASEKRDDEVESGPKSFLIDRIISKAYAETESERGNSALPVKTLKITSLDVTNGSISFVGEEGASPVLVTGIDFSARNIDKMPSSEDPSKEIIRAAVRAGGSAFGSEVQNVSIGGNLVFDEGGKIIAVSDSTVYLAGVQASLDCSINLSSSLPIFDIHAATMAFTPAMLSSVYRDAINEVVSRLEWQGPIALDLFAKGSPVAYELKVQLDGAQSSMAYGGVFVKSAGLPMKLQGVALVQPDAISIRESEITLGEAKLKAAGFVRRDDSLSYEITLDGDGLSDPQIKNYFPPLAIVDSFKNLSATVKSRGEIKKSNGELSETRIDFASESLAFAGISLEDAEGSVISQGDILEFPVVRGKYAGGSFSGNGKLEKSEKHIFSFKGIASGVESSRIDSIGDVISGSSSIVVDVISEGVDQLTLAGNMKISGSMILDSGAWQSYNFGQLLFSQDTWKGIEVVSNSPLVADIKEKLEKIDGAISEFKSTFSLGGNTLSASEIGWKNPMYEAEGFSISIKYPERTDPASVAKVGDASIDGKGVVVIPKGIALQLVTDQVARGKLLDDQERMLLPVKVSGTVDSAIFQMDHVEFAKIAEERAAKSVSPPTTDPAKIIRPSQDGKSQKAGVSGKKTPSSGSPKPPASKKDSLPDGQSSEKKETDDLLRVIIGR